MKGRYIITGVALAAAVAAGTPAWAVKVKSGAVSGAAKSGASGPQTGSGTVTVIDDATAPSTASSSVFVITSVCVNAENPSQVITVQSNPAGSVWLRLATGTDWSNCKHFEPGLIVPAGADVQCDYAGVQNWSCTVSGIVTKE